MSRSCEHCGRGPLKGHTRSHSNIATVRHQRVNLQWKKINGTRMRVCTTCIKTLSKKIVAA